MKEKLQFDSGETYDRLMADVITINNVAIATAGTLPDHLQDRLEKAARGALKTMKGVKK